MRTTVRLALPLALFALPACGDDSTGEGGESGVTGGTGGGDGDGDAGSGGDGDGDSGSGSGSGGDGDSSSGGDGDGDGDSGSGGDGDGDGDSGGGDPGACDPPTAYTGSTAQGEYGVGFTDYAAGSVRVGSVDAPIAGTVYYPADGDGRNAPAAGGDPFPVVFMLHGNHGIYRAANGGQVDCFPDTVDGNRLRTLAEIQQIYPGATVIPNHLGHAFLGESLAAVGYVVVLIDGNAVNCFNPNQGFVPERGQLIRGSVSAFASETPVSELEGRIDFSQVVYAGHSRGAEAVIDAALDGAVPGTQLAGIISIAGTNYLYDGSDVRLDAPFFGIIPAADGDVSFNGGMRYYDAAVPGGGSNERWFRAQHYVHGANHNFFNSEWTESFQYCGQSFPGGDNGQGNGDDRLARDDQEAYLAAAFRTFLDATTRGDVRARWALQGHADIQGIEEIRLARAFGNATGTLPLPNSPTQSDMDSVGLYPFAQGGGAYNGTFFRRFGTGRHVERRIPAPDHSRARYFRRPRLSLHAGCPGGGQPQRSVPVHDPGDRAGGQRGQRGDGPFGLGRLHHRPLVPATGVDRPVQLSADPGRKDRAGHR